ncbi:MAG: NAD(P)/FAD-dependent oxidoreductase [Gammaproteobacteria bacterium]|jgi:NADH dehydrogenase
MKNIVVVGGGFAGTAAVKQLEPRLPADWQAVLVSEENYMAYTPLLPEVAGASLLPGHAVAPIRKMLRRTRYHRCRVLDVDLRQRWIHLEAGQTVQTMPYEHLVLACGKVPDMSFIDGMAEHALPLKTLGDALHIRNRVIVSLERAEMEDDSEARRRMTTFVVVGGGSSGVEVAGAVADFLNAARKYYPRMRETAVRVVLLEGGGRLLSEFPGALGASALRLMRRNGIDVRLNARAAAVTEYGLEIEGGGWIEADNIICTIGTAPNPLVERLDLPREKGLIKTSPDMSVPGLKDVWAIGDCAAVINADDGALSPPTAQFAVRQGKQLARNIARAVADRPSRPFSYRSRGQLATIGHRKAVAHVLGMKLSGFPAWLIWRAVYLAMLPTLVRKLQVFSEWNLELLFPRDMTQLNFARTSWPRGEADKASESGQRTGTNDLR